MFKYCLCVAVITLTACQQANEAVQRIGDSLDQTAVDQPTANDNLPTTTETDVVREVVIEKEKIVEIEKEKIVEVQVPVEVRVEVPVQPAPHQFPNEAIAKNPLAPPQPPPPAHVPLDRAAVYNRIGWVTGIYRGSGYRDGVGAIRWRKRAGYETLHGVNLAKVHHDHPTLPALARYNYSTGVTYRDGFLYICDTDNHRIRRYNLAAENDTNFSGNEVTTFAGQRNEGTDGLYCTDGPLQEARFYRPRSLAFSPDGAYLYVAEMGNHTIRRIRMSDGMVETVAGLCTSAHPNERKGYTDGVGSEARFYDLSGIAVDQDLTVYVADRGNRAIRKIAPNGEVTTIETNVYVQSVAIGDGYLYWDNLDTAQVLRRDIRTPGNPIQVVVGSKKWGPTHIPQQYPIDTKIPCVDADPDDPNDPDNVWPPTALPDGVRLVFTDGLHLEDSTLFVSDFYTNTIWKADLSTLDAGGSFAPTCQMLLGRGAYANTPAGPIDFRNSGTRDGSCEMADLSTVRGITRAGNHLYMTDAQVGLARVTLTGDCKVEFIGGQLSDTRWRDGVREQARFLNPLDMTQLPNGDLLLADESNQAIRRVRFDSDYAHNGQLSVETVAGVSPDEVEYKLFWESGHLWGFPVVDDLTSGKDVRLYAPRTLTVDLSGRYAFVMGRDNLLRMMLVDDTSPNYGATKTIAGECIRHADTEENASRPIDRRACSRTVARDGLGTAARFTSPPIATSNTSYGPTDIVAGRDAAGNEVLYIADATNHAIRRVRPVQCATDGTECIPAPISFDAQYLVDTPYGVLGQTGNVDWPSAAATGPGDARIALPAALAYVETSQGGRYLFTSSNSGRRLRQIVITPRSGDSDTAPGTVRTLCESGRSGVFTALPNTTDGSCFDSDITKRPSIWFNALTANVYPAQEGDAEDRVIFYVGDRGVPTIWQLDLQTGHAAHMIPFGQSGAHDGDLNQASLGLGTPSLVYNKTHHRIFLLETQDSALREIVPVQQGSE